MATKKQINFVVTDLDDTIWDWLHMWYQSFNPYLERMSREFGIPKADLTKDFKTLHQKYYTTEASFIYSELTTLTTANKNVIDKFSTSEKSILHEYYYNKKHNLHLYNGVLESLRKIKSSGAIIVGFTESNVFFTKYRLKHLNLDGLFDCIYAPIDNAVPKDVYRHYSEEYWEPRVTDIRYLSKSIKKPNSEILDIILKDFGAEKSQAIYIGDKLDRDIYMAQQSEICSVYAKYGHQIENEKYALLRDVTHWTDEDVKREIAFKHNFHENPKPDFVLEKSFNEILDYFDFTLFPKKANKENLDNVVKIWHQVVQVQQHFNGIALTIRNYALTLLTFLLAGIGFCEKEKIYVVVFGANVAASSMVALGGLFVMLGFFYMDRFWYHKFLIGAVKLGGEIETRWSKYLPELGLTNAISESSPNEVILRERKGKPSLTFKVHSKHKFYVFYGIIFFVLIVLFFALLKKQTDPVKTGSSITITNPSVIMIVGDTVQSNQLSNTPVVKATKDIDNTPKDPTKVNGR